MTDPNDFNDFVESVLVEAANRQTGREIAAVNLTEICRFLHPDVAPTWIGSTSDWLRSQRLGEVIGDSEDPDVDWFVINSSGISCASAIRASRKPPTVTDRLASDKFQKLSSLGLSTLSFLVSVCALIVAIVALSKVN